MCHPVYSNFTGVIHKLGRIVASCHLLQPTVGDYQMDWERFEQVCAQERNKVFVLCSPENPVGRVWTPDELVRMAEICRENGVVLVSDEIHSDFVRGGVKHSRKRPVCYAKEIIKPEHYVFSTSSVAAASAHPCAHGSL